MLKVQNRNRGSFLLYAGEKMLERGSQQNSSEERDLDVSCSALIAASEMLYDLEQNSEPPESCVQADNLELMCKYSHACEQNTC